MSKYKYFTNDELKCKCGCEQQFMDEIFMSQIDTLRELYGKPIIVTSAYRCPEYNEKISTTGRNGPHTTGKAIDILVDRENAHKLLDCIFSMLEFSLSSGVGINQKGNNRFIHIDSLTPEEGFIRPTIWSY